MTYNGWSNYETWNVALWLGNDQGTDDMCREWAQEAWDEAKEPSFTSRYLTRRECAVRSVSMKLQVYIEENNPLASDASVYSDILSANLHEVDWGEIAKGMIEEVEEEAEVTT